MSDAPFIAAFDLATATGCADGRAGEGRPRLWTWFLSDAGEGRPQRLALLRRFLDAYFAEWPVDVVIYEKPLNIGAIAQMMSKGIYTTSEDVLATLRGSIGVLEACAGHAGIKDIRGMDIKDARKHLTGQRTFTKGTAKAATMRAAGALGWDPQDDNQADAAALWSLACGQASPLAAAMGRAHLAAKETPQTIGRRKDPNRGTLFAETK